MPMFGIDGPEQDGVDPAVALVDVVEVAIDGVFAGDRVVEVAIFDHRLRLDVGRLRPFQLGAAILGIVVFDALAGIVPPGVHFLEPRIATGRVFGAADDFVAEFQLCLLRRLRSRAVEGERE